MTLKVTVREATVDDVPEMVRVLFSALSEDFMCNRCFPPSDPACHTFWGNWIEANLKDPPSHMLLAIAEGDGEGASTESTGAARPVIAGWARWVRRVPDPAAEEPPRLIFTPDMYPASGDGSYAAAFFQANYDASRRAIGRQPHWFLSMMVVRRDFGRRGVGAQLMRFGVENADREGWMAYVNASSEGRGLYERFGFKAVETSAFEGVTRTWHMKRDAVKQEKS